jgi:PAS domain S-box-containing protein
MTVPARTEVKIVTKSGDERWMDFTAGMIEYEGEKAVMGTAFDITDRKRAHKALGESETRFRALIERSHDLVTLVDENAIIRYVSPNISRMLGYDDQELVGRNAFDPVHPDDIESMLAVFRELIRGPATSPLLIYRYRHKDGSWHWLEGVATSLADEIDGASILVNNRDVTDRHRAEEEARQRLAELAHVLRVGAVDEMASGLAHEINQPLAAIVNYARGSLLRLETEQAPALAEIKLVLGEIADQAIRAGEVVRSLRRFVRKEPPRKEPVVLNTLVRNVVRLVENEVRQLRIALRCDLLDEPDQNLTVCLAFERPEAVADIERRPC